MNLTQFYIVFYSNMSHYLECLFTIMQTMPTPLCSSITLCVLQNFRYSEICFLADHLEMSLWENEAVMITGIEIILVSPLIKYWISRLLQIMAIFHLNNFLLIHTNLTFFFRFWISRVDDMNCPSNLNTDNSTFSYISKYTPTPGRFITVFHP